MTRSAGRSACLVSSFLVSLCPALAEGVPAQPDPRVVLNELHAAPKPKPQADLNTFELASAHRERARSMQERTDGLWQSWLVSVCEGCGPERRPFSRADVDDLLRRTQSGEAPPRRTGAARRLVYLGSTSEAADEGSLATGDLSTPTIERVRRNPNR